MTYFKKVLRYIIPYKKFAFLNIFFNILYAIFSALSLVVLMPLLKVIFRTETEKKIEFKKPVYEGLMKSGDYFSDFMNYQISQMSGEPEKMLLWVILLIVVVFLLKNIFSYLATLEMTCIRKLYPCQFLISLKKEKEILCLELEMM